MSTVQPTDKVLVNRAGTDYSATADTLMATIQDTDLLLVNRAGVDYKCSGLDFKAAMKPPETVDKPSITSPSNGAGQTITPLSDEITSLSTSTAPAYENFFFTGATPATYDPNAAGKDFHMGSGGMPPSAVFDGDIATGTLAQNVGGSWLYFKPVPGIAGVNKLRIYGPWIGTVRINGTVVGTPNLTVADWYEIPTPPSTVTEIAVEGNVPNGAVGRLHAIEVNGQLLVSNQVFTVLHLQTGKDLASFKAGDAVTEQTAGGTVGDATGTVNSVDATANTITLSASAGTWDVGSSVLGTPSLSADAALGKNPTFTSSAFSGTNGATHVSTDWQVTTKADTGFAAIVQQSMADTTNKVRWDSGDLSANTDYIARVRYHSAGAVSAWSNVVEFKTKTTFT